MGPEDLSDVELLVREGIDAAGASDHARARDLLGLAVTLDGGSLRGWLWLSAEVDDLEDQAYCLKRALALYPGNELARRGLAWLREQARLEEQARLKQQARWPEALRDAVAVETMEG